MPQINAPLLAFNRGIVSKLALARTDIERIKLSAEIQTNWMPRSLGSMMLRAGWKYIGGTLNDAQSVNVPFVFSASDTAIIELSGQTMRVRVDETIISRPSVSSQTTNGTFDSDLANWTDADESGATSAFVTGGYMGLTGTGTAAAIRTQTVTVSGADQGVEHALEIVVDRGPIVLRVGSTSGADDYVRETTLGTGNHSLAFSPLSNFFIRVSNRRNFLARVDSITVAPSGEMRLAAPWGAAALDSIRWDQSADVIYIACDGFQQRKIERRGTRSWSLVRYEPEDGPFRNDNASSITLTPSGTAADITVTASVSLFDATHVGALFRIADGIVRVTGYTSATQVSARVLSTVVASATSNWAEGVWSDFRGWPTSVTLDGGRLGWFGNDRINLSASDDYEVFDAEIEGDSAPINRTIGSGPVDKINWALSLSRLVIGAEMSEKVIKASSLDEPLTVTDFTIRDASTYGSTNAAAFKIDADGVFVRGTRLMRITNENNNYSDYRSFILNVIAPEVGSSGIRRISVQRYPDTRIHCVRNDGTAAVLIYDEAEEVNCWVLVETDGIIEDVVVLPPEATEEESRVYYVVRRTINNQTKRYLERWALESDCQGGTLNHQADSYIQYSGAATTSISGLSHLEGQRVVVWANGKDMGSYTVSGGAISGLPENVTSAIVGLPYSARYKSTKLAYAAGAGTALTQRKRIEYLGVIMQNTHYQGLRYGPRFDRMENLPLVEDWTETPEGTVWESYDKEMFSFDGEWDTDARLCLEAQAPRPCTLLAAIMTVYTSDKG